MFDREFLKQILNSIADPVFVKDRRHKWVYLNQAFCDFMGYSREELIGKSDYDYFPKEEADVFWKKDEDVFNSIRENFNEEKFTDAEGVVHTIHTKKSFYVDSQGEKVLVGIIRDVTEIQQANEVLRSTRSFLDSVVDNIPNMVFVKEADQLRFVSLNRAGEKLLGMRRGELIGKNDYDFFPKEEADFFAAKDHSVLEKKEQLEIPEEPIQTRTKGLRYLRTIKVPVLDRAGRPVYLLGISEDITEKKKELENREQERRELEMMNRMMVNREVKMVDLKKEIDRLLGELGRPPRYGELQ